MGTITNSYSWDKARQIIRIWLNSSNRSMRQMADEAGINVSVISRFVTGQSATLTPRTVTKLYAILHHNLSTGDKQTLVHLTGLAPIIASYLGTNTLVPDAELSEQSFSRPHQLGFHLLGQGIKFWANRQQSLSYFQQAEKAFGPGSGNAARAASLAANQLIELGDYAQAHAEIQRIQTTYAHTMKAETEWEFYRVGGWLYYSMGRYVESQQWCEHCIEIAQQMGQPELGETAHHFLARGLHERGKLADPRQRVAFFQKAEEHYDLAYKLHLTWDNKNTLAYDLFRKGQLARTQNNWREARYLYMEARQLFGKKPGRFSIDLEEARLEVANGEVKAPTLVAEDALRGWAVEHKAYGMAEALQLLGVIQMIQGNLEQAFTIISAGLCICPNSENPEQHQLWSLAAEIRDDIVRQHGFAYYKNLAQKVQDAARDRQGYFGFIDNVFGERNSHVDQVMNRLVPSHDRPPFILRDTHLTRP